MLKGKCKKVIGLMKDELGGKIMKKFVELKAKAYSYFKDDGSEDKNAKGKKKCVIKRKTKLRDKNCLEPAQLENKINHLEIIKLMWIFLNKYKLIFKTQQRFRSGNDNAFTEEINKITLSPNDDKRIRSRYLN